MHCQVGGGAKEATWDEWTKNLKWKTSNWGQGWIYIMWLEKCGTGNVNTVFHKRLVGIDRIGRWANRFKPKCNQKYEPAIENWGEQELLDTGRAFSQGQGRLG